MKLKMKTSYISIILSLFLFSCDSKPTFAELCDQYSEICHEFEEDSWCKRERIAVGYSNIMHLQNQDDNHKYHVLIAYEDYAKCMDFASQIEHIKLKHKRTMRINNAIKAKEKIIRLSKETENSRHPNLLYFHWTRYLNEQALHKFLLLEGTSALETPESQLNLATYYSKRKPGKTLSLLYHALELYKADEVINKEIFKSLTSIFTEKKEAKQAYIWLKVLQLYDPEDENIGKNSLENFVTGYQLDGEFLDKVAASTLSKIQTGKFKAPNF